jgi:hypothetical protein
MADICQQLSCASEVTALATENPAPSGFMASLQEEQLYLEAVQILARYLPKEKAVQWSAQSARLAGESTGLSAAEDNALGATEAWATSPSSTKQMAVADSAHGLQANSPTFWTTQAVAFADGVEVPEGSPPLQGSEDLTAHCAAGAVLLAAAQTTPDGVPAVPEGSAPSDSPMSASANSQALETQMAEQLEASQQPSAMPSEQRAAANKSLEPFLKLGLALAQTVPGWF